MIIINGNKCLKEDHQILAILVGIILMLHRINIYQININININIHQLRLILILD